jgi:hypothetical protein
MLGNGVDGFLWIFFADNFKERIILLQNPFYTTRMFYPTGRELYFYDYSTFILFIISLFSLFFNYIISFNLTLILIFVLNFLCMYFLTKFLTKKEGLSLLIGFLFSVSPFNYSSALGHLTMLSVFVFPLTTFFLLKKNKLILTLSLILTFLIRLEYFFYLFFLLPLISIVFEGFNRKILKFLFLPLVVSLMVFVIIYFPAIATYIKSPSPFQSKEKENHLEPWTLFLPNPFSLPILIFPKKVFTTTLLSSFYTGDESIKGIGIIPTTLFLYSLYLTIKNKTNPKFKVQKKLFLLALLIYFLILTPIIDILLQLPFFNSIRVKSRIFIISIFLIYVAVSLTLNKVKIKTSFLFLLLLSHLIISIPINFPTTKIYNIEGVQRIKSDFDVTVLNVPCVPFGYYLQTIHKKPTVDGLFTRAEQEATKFYFELLKSCEENPEKFKQYLNQIHLKYVIVQQPYINWIKTDKCIELYYRCIKKNNVSVEEIITDVDIHWPIIRL